MRATLEGRAPGDIAALLREPVVVHENSHVPRLLDCFRQTGAAMAVVLDEYGGLEGIVTLTDILEAIAGELPSDQEGPAAVRRDDGSWLVDGSVGVAEVESLTGLSELASAGNFHSLAGFLLARLHHLPTVGEHVEWQGWRLEVVDMDGRRIDRVLVSPPAPSQETSDSGV
jgi:putative hemolysin